MLTATEALDEVGVLSTLHEVGDGFAGVINLLLDPRATYRLCPRGSRGRASLLPSRASDSGPPWSGAGRTLLAPDRLRGEMGLNGSEAPMLGGVISGFTKALAKEWSQSEVRRVDVEVASTSTPTEPSPSHCRRNSL